MATSTIEKTQLKLQFENGMVDGKQKYATKSFSNVMAEASDDALLSVSNSINALTEKEILRTTKVVTSSINA